MRLTDIQDTFWKKNLGSNNLGAPTPMNTLNGSRISTSSSSSSRLVSRPSRSQGQPHSQPQLQTQPQSSPPPSKRRKIQGSQHAHTEAHFAPVVDPDALPAPASRKRSASDSLCSASDTYVTASAHSPTSRANVQNVSELRQVDKMIMHKTKRARYKRVKDSTEKDKAETDSTAKDDGAEEEVFIMARPSHIRFKSDDDDDGDPLAEDDEVEFVPPYKVPGAKKSSQQQPGQGLREQKVSLMDIGRRFRSHIPHGAGKQGINADGVDRKRARVDYDIDELSLDTDDNTAKIRTSHTVPKSTSLSTKGDVERTRFKGTGSGTKSNHREQEAHPLTTSVERAKEIIDKGLTIKRAVDGQFRYPSDLDGHPCCLLSPVEMSDILHPTDGQGRMLKEYSYLTVNLKKSHRIALERYDSSCVICVTRSVEPQNSIGAKILIELPTQEAEKFCSWVKIPREYGKEVKLG